MKRSKRGLSESQQRLASLITSGKQVVFITGAGLSAPSGIPTFRGENDSIWFQR